MIGIILLGLTLILRRTKVFKKYVSKKIYKLLIIVEVAAIVLSIGEYLLSNVFFDNTLKRPAVGEKDVKEEMVVTANGEDQDIEVTVPAQTHTLEEQADLISKAKEEIDETFLGENESFENINQPVVMKENYVDGLVSAEWQFDNYKVVGAEGDINYDKYEKDTLVNAKVTLTIEDTSEVYAFPFQVTPLSSESPQGTLYYIKKLLTKISPQSEEITLPDKVGETELSWSKKYTFIGTKIGILGFLGAMAMVFGERFEAKSKKKKHQKLLERDYPKIVENIALYVGAGLSVKNALYRISEEYLKRRSEKIEPGFEGVLRVSRLIEEGKSEIEALNELQKICNVKEYRRLVSLLVSNIKKGSKGMLEMLEREEESAFEMQKQYVKVAGEEASTKMLLPLIGLLGIVLVIIIAPAIFNMQI